VRILKKIEILLDATKNHFNTKHNQKYPNKAKSKTPRVAHKCRGEKGRFSAFRPFGGNNFEHNCIQNKPFGLFLTVKWNASTQNQQ